MGRRRQERRKVAEERWPRLLNLMASYFNQDSDILYGSLEGAIAAASRDGSLDHRKGVLKEWRDWQFVEGAVVDFLGPFSPAAMHVAVSTQTSMNVRGHNPVRIGFSMWISYRCACDRDIGEDGRRSYHLVASNSRQYCSTAFAIAAAPSLAWAFILRTTALPTTRQPRRPSLPWLYSA